MSPRYENPTLSLLRAYHGLNPASPALPRMTREQVRYLYDVGLGPVVAALDVGQFDADSHQLLQAADLTARVLFDQSGNAAAAVLEVANRQATPVVLIKGISTAERYYPDPHHRVMGDIDLLVLDGGADELQDALLRSGFKRAGVENGFDFSRHHHLPPLHHAETGFSVEIHKRLFSHRFFNQEPLFAESQLASQTEPAQFRGLECRRFRSEFELLYTVAHWAVDGGWAQNIVSINDALSLLQSRKHELDWIQICGWLEENAQTADCFAVLFGFLHENGLVGPIRPLESTLRSARARVGRTNLHLLHWLLSRYPLRADWHKRPFGSSEAVGVWQALLESRTPGKRLLFAVFRAAVQQIRIFNGRLFRALGIRRE